MPNVIKADDPGQVAISDDGYPAYSFAHAGAIQPGIYDRGTLQVGPGQLRRTIAGARLRLQSPNHRENRALQGSIRETVEAAWRNEEFVDASVVSEDWNVRTNRITNRPIERTVQAMVVVKGRESGLCRVYEQSFTQQARTDRAGWVPGLTMGTGTNSPFPCPGR